jgi:hypothetical protein
MVELIITLIVTVPIAWLWANAIDKHTQFKKQNPDYKETGWLDWDK